MPKRPRKQGSSTDAYRAKRDFGRTPEPLPGPAGKRSSWPIFVVHRHEARRLHYDLRIEMEGALKSWAVPKGFSYDPGDKRLAVRTEDHPLEYEDFDGVIPKGEYGAGTMTIWDRGRYEFLGDSTPESAVKAGKLELRFYGGRLRGEWHMVRLKKSGTEWLMFKSRDRYARDREIPPFSIDVTRMSPQPMPKRLRAMSPGSRVEPFTDPSWLYELKLLGSRVFAEKNGDDIRFRGTRRKLDRRLQPLVQALGQLRAENAILDGVLVCLDDDHRPSPELLDAVLAGSTDRPIDYYAFDLLYYEEWDLRGIPLIERKAALASILPASNRIVFVEHERSRGGELQATVARAGLGGCIAKRADGLYRGGPSPDWVEVATSTKEGNSTTLLQALSGHETDAPRAPDGVRFTNLKKVLWPRDGYTKGDLIRYYDAIADVLLPYLRQRPLSLHRFPNGIESESFFQKNTPSSFPDWIRTEPVPGSTGRGKQIRYVVCDDRATLLYLANLASIELHPWSSQLEQLDSPDWAILDLDPATDDFGKVLRVARLLGKLLRGIGLRPSVKTSGAKGLHVYVPLREGYTYDQVRMFCEGIASYAAHELSDIATVERAKARRGSRVYIDFLQNRRGQTIVAPYAVRPVHGATVSAPLDWDELSSDMHPSQFTIETVPARVSNLGDLFRATLSDRQELLPAIEAFQKQLSAGNN